MFQKYQFQAADIYPRSFASRLYLGLCAHRMFSVPYSPVRPEHRPQRYRNTIQYNVVIQ